MLLFFVNYVLWTRINLVGMRKPNSFQLILKEFTFHSNDFNFVDLSDVKAHLMNLFKAIFLLIILHKIDVITKTFVFIANVLAYVLHIHRCVEIYNYRKTTPHFTFNSCLNTFNRFPFFIVSSCEK
jgi:hypothetical protein